MKMDNQAILCVDDDPTILALLREILKEDYPLLFARNGERALQVVEKFKPKLILMDVKMPRMGGITACRQLKANPETAHIPIIFLTSVYNPEKQVEGFNVGAVDYITKPFDPSVVQMRLKKHLERADATVMEKSYHDAMSILKTISNMNFPYGSENSWQIGSYSKKLAEALGWSKEDADMLEIAAGLHDLGMFGLPESLRKSPEKLTFEEHEMTISHTMIGYEILSKAETPVFKMAAEIALYHHEFWNGGGYPMGLSGHQIPESARIVAVASFFCSLSRKTDIEGKKSIEEVGDKLRLLGGNQLDPRLVRLFLQILPDILPYKIILKAKNGGRSSYETYTSLCTNA